MISSYFNEWLDEYNDYMRLYMLFGDEYYLGQAGEALESLKALVQRSERHKRILWKMMSDKVHVFSD